MKIDYTKILNEAFRITFKNKWLWVFGLVLAMVSGGGMGSGGGGNSSPNNTRDNMLNNTIKNTTSSKLDNNNITLPLNPSDSQGKKFLEQTENALDEATISLKSIAKAIPLHFYIALALLAIVWMVIALALGFYIRGWATSSLIHGIDQESENNSLGLSQMSKMGKGKSIEMIKLNLIPGCILTLIFIIAVFVGIIIFATASVLQNNVITIIAGLILFLGMIIGLIYLIIVAMVISLARVPLVLKNLTWKESFKNAYKVVKGYFREVVFMSCINCCLGGLVSGITLALFIPIVLGAIGAAAGISLVPSLLLIIAPIALLGILALIAGFSLLNAILIVFNQATWVLLYKQIMQIGGTKLTKSQTTQLGNTGTDLVEQEG